MASVLQNLMTAEEFYDFVHRPENRDRHFELEKRDVVEVSRPGEKHCAVCGNGVGILWTFVHQRKKGYVCPSDMGWYWNAIPTRFAGPISPCI